MIEIFTKLRGNKANNAGELRKALAQVDMAALEAEVAAAGKARRDALFVSEAAAEEAEARHAKAVRDLERGKIVRDELTARLQAAEAADADAALTRERNRVAKDGEELERAIRTKWPELQARMVAILQHAEEYRLACDMVNERISEAGRSDFVERSGWTLGQVTVLPHDDELRIEGWGRR